MDWEAIRAQLELGSQALFSNPQFWASHPRVLFKTGAYLRRDEGPDFALMFLDRLAERRALIPGEVQRLLQHLRANCLLDMGRFAEAAIVYDRIIEADPADGVAFADRGFCKWEMQNIPGAIEDYLRATEIRPNDWLSWRHLGELFEKVDRSADALPALEKAVALAPADARTYRLLGITFFNLERWVEAHRALNRALEINPYDETAKLGLKKINEFFDLD